MMRVYPDKYNEAHSRMGTDIHAHGTMPTAGVIRPIETWTTEDVWDYLIKPDWTDVTESILRS